MKPEANGAEASGGAEWSVRDSFDAKGAHGLYASLWGFEEAVTLIGPRALAHARHAAGAGVPVATVSAECEAGASALARAIHALSPRAALGFHVVTAAADLSFEVVEGRLRMAPEGTAMVSLRGLPPEARRAFSGAVLSAVRSRPPGPFGVVVAVDGRMKRDPLGKCPHAAVWRLRDRREDIPPIAVYCATREGRPPARFSLAALALLLRAPWPGGLRDLVSCAERAAAARDLRGGARVELDDIPTPVRDLAPAGEGFLRDGVEAAERSLIAAALDQCDGMVKRAADELGVPERTLRRKMREAGLAKESFRPRTRGALP